MSVATKNPATKLTITWPLLPEDFQLPDDPVEDESQPLLAGSFTPAANRISRINPGCFNSFQLCPLCLA